MRANMQLAAEEAAGLQKQLLTELRQEVQDAATVAAVEQQKHHVEAQRAAETAAAIAAKLQHEHLQQLQAASEAVARQQSQQLQELQRVSDEQRRQLELAAQEHEMLEQQLSEGHSVVEAALEAVDKRVQGVQHPSVPDTPFSSSATSHGVVPEAVVVPGSATTIDVRNGRGVSFQDDPLDEIRRHLAKMDFRSISVPAVTAIRELKLAH